MLLNGKLDSVPMFCQSHLVMLFNVTVPLNTSINNPRLNSSTALRSTRPLTNFITDANIANASNPNTKPDRTFTFGKGNGGWQINGLGWMSAPNRIVAQPKRNGIEIWSLKNGGGGWFHPVHIHLVDFLVTYRFKNKGFPNGLFPYEVLSPKDVVFLGPGEEVRLIASWGPHDGSYMFHCHNLVHEDDDMMLAFAVNSSQKNGNVIPSIPVTPNDRTLINPMSRPATPGAPQVLDLDFVLFKDYYSVFYPSAQMSATTVPQYVFNASNPYEVDYTSPKCKPS